MAIIAITQRERCNSRAIGAIHAVGDSRCNQFTSYITVQPIHFTYHNVRLDSVPLYLVESVIPLSIYYFAYHSESTRQSFKCAIRHFTSCKIILPAPNATRRKCGDASETRRARLFAGSVSQHSRFSTNRKRIDTSSSRRGEYADRSVHRRT